MGTCIFEIVLGPWRAPCRKSDLDQNYLEPQKAVKGKTEPERKEKIRVNRELSIAFVNSREQGAKCETYPQWNF